MLDRPPILERVVRLLLRVAGWLLTPVVALMGAIVGAAVAAVAAPPFSPRTGVIAVFGGALIGATIVLWLWVRYLRHSPVLQEVLAVTPAGVPTSEAIAEVLGESSDSEEQ